MYSDKIKNNFKYNMENEELKQELGEGAFGSSLLRGSKEIKKDRALAIAEDAQTFYKREVEDLKLKLNKLIRARENALDFSPDNSLSLKAAQNFDAKTFVSEDMRMTLEIRTTRIEYEEAQDRYNYLFTKTVKA